MSFATIVCPFCPLHCDDVDPVRLNGSQSGCRLADERMAKVISLSPNDDHTDWDACRQWLEVANRVVVTGYVIDLETSRAISEFAKITGAEIQVASTNASAAQVFAREGAFLTTLGELSAREVSVLMVGNAASHWPRIDERLGPVTSIVRWPDSPELPGRIAMLRARAASRSTEIQSEDPQVESAVNLVIAASYLVVLVAPLRESIATSPVIWSSLLGFVRDRNKTSRAAILSFDPSMTLRHVMAARNDPQPWRFPSDESALQIAFSPFGESQPNHAGRTIVIGMMDKPLSENQRILPASSPGLQHDGIVIRGDGSVTLPLQTWMPKNTSISTLPTPADQLRRLM